MLDTNNSTPCN